MTTRRWQVVVLYACVAHTSLAGAAGAQERVQARDLFDRYRAGHAEHVVAQTDALSAAELDRVTRDLRRRIGEWVRDGGGVNVRLDAAVFLLDVAATRMERDWQAVRDLVELGCKLLEPLGTNDERVRQWHLASVALAQGAADVPFLVGGPKASKIASFDHLMHSRLKLADEPRLQLAAAVLAGLGRTDLVPPRDQPWVDDAALSQRPGAGRSEVMLRQERRAMLTRLTALSTAHPAIAHEARLRAAHVAYQNHDDQAALAHLDAAAGSGDVFVDYVASLLRAMICMRTGEGAAAETALREALRLVPTAQSGVGLLSRHLFLSGRHQEAQELLDTYFATRGHTVDPWRLFGYGDFRRLPALMASLRAGVGR